jgi:hypothetical protein
MRGARGAKRLVAAGQGGSIATTTPSMAVVNGSKLVEYGASKAAIINRTKSLGRRLGKQRYPRHRRCARPYQHHHGGSGSRDIEAADVAQGIGPGRRA